MTVVEGDPAFRWGNRERRTYRGRGGGRVPRIWTRERSIAALAEYAAENPGPLPHCSETYNAMKKGRNLPTGSRLCEYFGCIPHAWLAAGATKSRLPVLQCPWTSEEEAYLLEAAGTLTLKVIGQRLHRSWQACKRRLYDRGVKARNNPGYLSCQQLADELEIPANRVLDMVHSGRLPASKPRGVENRWQIAPDNLTSEILTELRKRPQRGSDLEWTHDLLETAIAMRDEMCSWHAIAQKLGVKNGNTVRYRVLAAFVKRPRWQAVWYVVKELGGTAAVLDVVSIMRSRGTLPTLMSDAERYSAVVAAARRAPTRLAVSAGVLSIVTFTRRRIRSWQRAERLNGRARAA